MQRSGWNLEFPLDDLTVSGLTFRVTLAGFVIAADFWLAQPSSIPTSFRDLWVVIFAVFALFCTCVLEAEMEYYVCFCTLVRGCVSVFVARSVLCPVW